MKKTHDLGVASRSKETITVTLADSACAVTMLASFGSTRVGFASLKYDDLVRRILSTPVDRSRGEYRAVRHVVLRPEEAAELLTAFRDSAETYRLAARRNLVAPCVEAAAAIEHALRSVGWLDTTARPAEQPS